MNFTIKFYKTNRKILLKTKQNIYDEFHCFYVIFCLVEYR